MLPSVSRTKTRILGRIKPTPKPVKWVTLTVGGVYIGRFSFCSIRGAIDIYDAFQTHEPIALCDVHKHAPVMPFWLPSNYHVAKGTLCG